VVTTTIDIVQLNRVVFEVFLVAATVDRVLWTYVVCGVYWGYSNCSYSAILLC